jgi:hypothetical protein
MLYERVLLSDTRFMSTVCVTAHALHCKRFIAVAYVQERLLGIRLSAHASHPAPVPLIFFHKKEFGI